MTRIKRAPRKAGSTHAGIAAFIIALREENSADDELPALLLPVVQSGWTWPRTDLQHWILPLNRFDAILEQVVQDYDLASMEHLQTNAFTPRTKQLVGAILAFEKVLLENSTNRKIFASFDRLNDLLHTTDLSILLATLRLGLRPAQQYSSTNGGTSSFGIAEKRLLSLAQGWGTREYGLEMVDLAGDEVEIPSELDELEWQFYKKASASAVKEGGVEPTAEKKDKGKETDAMDLEEESRPTASTSAVVSASTSTPGPKPRAAFAQGALLATPIPATPLASTSAPSDEGLTLVQLGNVRAQDKSAVDILADAIEAYGIPEPDRLDLLQKIRIAKALGSTPERRTMLVVRLLAIAVFAHTSTEASAQSKLFLYEPELIPQLAELVHPDRNVPIEIQAAAFYALDAIAKYKTKLSEVASALNASVSHGILMYVFRRTVTDLEGDNPVSTPEFIDSLFNLLVYFQTNSHVGNMIVGAGIVSMLVEFIKNKRRDRVAVVTRAVVFLDSLMYGYSSAFTLFISAGGLSVFVDRVKAEIELCIEAHSTLASDKVAAPSDSPTGLLSFEQASLLKGLLRAVQRLMQTAGTTEGLRNLIDSSLLSSVKAIMEHRVVFGPQVFALAINITATFVHNEPTCLATIQEARVPASLYDAIEECIPASIDVLQAIPNAVGALCLNTAGLDEFNARPLIKRYFSIFNSEKHVKVLQERDNGNMLGAAIDELIRHHPSLKDKVLESVVDVLKELREQAKSYTPETKQSYGLQVIQAVAGAASGEQPGESSSSGAAPATASNDVEMQDATAVPSPGSPEFKENYYMQAIDVVGRFLEGLFQNVQHCKDFVKLDPAPVLLDLLALPCMPVDAPATACFSSISAVFRIMSEVKPTESAVVIIKEAQKYLDKTQWFWETFPEESRLAPFLTPSEESLEEQNQRFRDLTILLSIVALLSDIYGNLTYAHGKASTSVLAVFSTPEEAKTLSQIGQLHRTCLWENILIKKLAPTPATLTTPSGAESSATPAAAPVAGSSTGGPAAEPSTEDKPEQSSSGADKEKEKPSPNLKAVQDLLASFPLNIVPVFLSTIKLFVHRRTTDAAHRKAANEVAITVANLMRDNLTWIEPHVQDISSRLSYSTLMFQVTTTFLFDERPNMTGLQTLLLSTFEKTGGFAAYLKLYTRFHENAGELMPTQDAIKLDDVKLPIVHVFGGLKVALDLLHRLASHRTILEAPQTALLLARVKDKASPDYFDPHALLVKLRAAILPVVASTWAAPWLKKSPPNVVRSIVGTLVHILKGEAETSVDHSTGRVLDQILGGAGLGGLGGGGGGGRNALEGLLGALGGGGGGGGGPGGAGGAFVLDQTRVAQLVDMGFPRSAVETALTRCRNNIGVATEYLLGHPDLVGAARAREAAQPPPSAAAPAAAEEANPPAPADDAPAPAAPAADEAQVAPDAAAQDPQAPAAEAVEADQDVAMAEAEAPAPASVVQEPAPITVDDQKAREEALKQTKEQLKQARDALKPDFLSRALSLAEDYSELVFDIKGVFSLLNSSDQDDSRADKQPASLKPLLDDLAAPFPEDAEARRKADGAAATRLRLIALLAADAAYRETIEKGREELMKTLVRYQQQYSTLSPDKDNRPSWLASVMLVADSLFSIAEVPKGVLILPEGEEVPSPALVSQGPQWSDERAGFFQLSIDVLAKGISTREVFLSTLRLILVLTRDHALASSFVKAEGLRHLFSSFSTERPETDGCRSYVTMILRHVIEDRSILLPMMEREIEAWFAQPRAKVADITGFLRGVSSIASRNNEVFLEATRSTCKLVQADAAGHYHVALQKEPQAPSKPAEADSNIRSPFAGEDASTATAPEMVSDETSGSKQGKASAGQALPEVETTVHFLMAEALDSSKGALAPIVPSTQEEKKDGEVSTTATSEAAPAPGPVVAPESPKKDSKDAHIPVDTPLGDFYQTSFALSSLAELLSSYSMCKTSFLNFSTRRIPGKELAPAGPVKPRSSFLYFLLNDLIPLPSVLAPSDFESKRRSAISHFASLVIIALCYDASPVSASKEAKEAASTEVANVRKTVLDSVARAFKDAASAAEPTDIRYGRLFALSDLCYRLLTSRPFPGIAKANDETSMQLAKLMLEKNFAGILTNALADVDLNFPSVNNLINSILRPLEQLTKVVTKVGRSKNAVPTAGRLEDENTTDSDSFDEDDELEVDSEEEEAPDLYRNSALGMYEGELEPGHQEDAYMSGDSAEEYDEDDELMDEMEDGAMGGSDVSDISDDEDDDEDAQAFADEMEMALDEEDDDGSDGDTDGSDMSEREIILNPDEEDEMMGAFVDEDDIEEEEDGEDEGEWIDEPQEDDDGPGADGAGQNGDGFAEGDQGPGGIIEDEDDVDIEEGDSEDPDSYTDEEEMYLTGELEFEAGLEEEMRREAPEDPALRFMSNDARRQRITEMMMGGGDGSIFDPRRAGNAVPQSAAHPLLVDAPAPDARPDAPSRRQRGNAARGPEYEAWAADIERMLGPGGVDTLHELLSAHGLAHLSGPDQLRVGIAPGPDGTLAMVIDPTPAIQQAQAAAAGGGGGIGALARPQTVHRHTTTATSTTRSTARQLGDRLNATTNFLPVQTAQRWQEESRITQGSVLVAERIARLVNHVINILHAPARAIAKEAKQKEQDRLAKLEEKRAKDEAERAAKSTSDAAMEVEGSSTATDASAQVADAAEAMEGVTMQDDVAEVMNLARSLAAGLAVPSVPTPPSAEAPAPAPTVEPRAPEVSASEAAVDMDHDAEANQPEASGSGAGQQPIAEAAPAEQRVYITIQGQEVDITDTGIDPTFLEALPDEMREEVLSQHHRESRSSGPAPIAPDAAPSQINSEFLDALPPDLRAEVLRQEAAEQRREQAAARAAAREAAGGAAPAPAAAPAAPAEIDPADFLASLDPQLREAVLLEQEDDFLQALPADIVAEANVLRDRDHRRHAARRPPPAAQNAVPAPVAAKKAPVHREAIQLLDKGGLATLVRLLFFPQPLRRNVLQKVLVNLCENSRTRTELINLLLTILQDGTRDVSAVDKSFSQMSLRASKSLGAKDTPRRKVLETPGGALPHFPGESVPNLIAQRCLEALTFLVSSNDQSPLFFLTEQEVVVGLSRRSAKKGKGKEKAVPSTTFPVIVLLGLLDRPALLKTQSMMDSLTQLLSAITKSLSVLQKKSKAPEGVEETPVPAATPVIEGAAPPQPAPAADGAAPAPGAGSTSEAAPTDAGKEAKDTTDILLKNPPLIPAAVLRLVVNILDAGECSSKTFQQTLVLIQNLSYLPEAREVISEELKVRAQSLSDSLVPDLDELHRATQGTEQVRGVTLAKFSPASSLQAKLLRILKTIDWVNAPPKKTPASEDIANEEPKLTPEQEKVKEIFNAFHFAALWQRLGDCLTSVEARPELLYLATVLLPLIESLMVVSKYVFSAPKKVDASSPKEAVSPSAEVDANSMEAMFLDFTDKHKKILNTMVKNNPSLLSGSFSILIHNPKVLEFENKRSYFFSRLHDRSQRQRNHYGTLQVNVRRQYVFEDSFRNLQGRSGDEIKYGKLNVKFYDEEGVDAGGVTREWFSVLARQMFNPGYALFQPQAADALTYQPNKSSSINREHLSFFKFVGRIIGKALHDQRILEAYFSRSVYKHILGKRIDHNDLESIDPEYHKSLVWMLDNDIDGVLDLTFSVERDDFGVVEVVDLVPNGRNVAVTNENKHEYVRLIADQRLSIEIKDQMNALLKGLYEIVPKDLLRIFSEKELELLISGLPEIDVDEWRANTDLRNFSPTDPIISYFWRAVRSFSHEERAKLLQFVSGSSRVPLEGFASLQGMSGITKFAITSAGATAGLPTAHTCFNQLDLGTGYDSYEALRKALLTAITEGAGGFGFA